MKGLPVVLVCACLFAMPSSQSWAEPCQADINIDGKVNLIDLTIFKTEAPSCCSNLCQCDLNGDAIFNLLDVVIMRREYGETACEGVCRTGEIRICDTGLAGACKNGVKMCFDNYWSNCIAPYPSDELCDNADNDCDGLVDEEGICLSSMAFPGNEWFEIAPEHVGVNIEKLNMAMDYLAGQVGPDGINNVVVIRNGYLIWKGPACNVTSDVWSVTKSVISTTLGLLIDEGKADLNTLSKDYLPAMEQYYPDVSLRHFTTFTSGYHAFSETDNTMFYIPLPPLSDPGDCFYYYEAAMDQFANTLTRIADEELTSYFKRKIADEIQMNEYEWYWISRGEVDGYRINGGTGLCTSSRQLARIGHLFLNNGNWNGTQLISEEWVREATQLQVPASTTCNEGVNLAGRYGYNWWVNDIGPDGFKTWPNAPDDTYCAYGHKFNALFVIPSWNMVIARVGANGIYYMYYGPSSPWDVFLQKIGDSIIE